MRKKILIIAAVVGVMIIFVAFCWKYLWVSSESLMPPYVYGGEADIASFSSMIEPVTGMEFVWISGGCYDMGVAVNDGMSTDIKNKGHNVCVDGFWAGVNEVTRGQYRTFVEVTQYKTIAEQKGWSLLYNPDIGRWEKTKNIYWDNPGIEQTDHHPVVHVAYPDAVAMGEWLSTLGMGMFRLPTEAEWEFACRAGASTRTFWGDDKNKACEYANVHDIQSALKANLVREQHQCDDGNVYTSAVGSYAPNNFHLHDMIGNVWEWVLDDYSEDAYEFHVEKNPVAKTLFRYKKMFRGGGWCSTPTLGATCANRYAQSIDRRNCDLGFRLVLIPKK